MNRDARPIFERIVELDSSLCFDFNHVLKAMKCLFGQNCIVVFECV